MYDFINHVSFYYINLLMNVFKVNRGAQLCSYNQPYFDLFEDELMFLNLNNVYGK